MPDAKKFIECDSGSNARMRNGPRMHGIRKESLCLMMIGFAHTHTPAGETYEGSTIIGMWREGKNLKHKRD